MTPTTPRVIRVTVDSSDREFCTIIVARSDGQMPSRPKLSDLPEDAKVALIDWLGLSPVQIRTTE